MVEKQEKAQKALVAKVAIGPFIVEGLMLPDGTYAIGFSQLEAVNLVPQKNASRYLKSLLGKGFKFLKVDSELNRKQVNVLTLDQFIEVVKILAMKGNSSALDFLCQMAGLSLHQLFSDAFGQQLEEKDRQEWLTKRLTSKITRKQWIDLIRDRYIELYGEAPGPSLYQSLTVIVNQRLFGRPHFNRNRDNMTLAQLKKIQTFEGVLVMRMEKHPLMKPDDAVLEALNFMS